MPVITLTGKTFANRVATSIVHAATIGEFAASTIAEYEALAVSLATDRAKLKKTKEWLRDHRDELKLFDT